MGHGVRILKQCLSRLKRLPFWLRTVVCIQLVLLVWLQADIWLGYGGVHSLLVMRQNIQTQQTENERLRVRNARLDQEVQMLKMGPQVTEEKARLDLGMVKDNETFFLWVD